MRAFPPQLSYEAKSKTKLIESSAGAQSVPLREGGFQDLPLRLVVTPAPPVLISASRVF
jgi:hypothetical protein